jgi:histone H3/H4
MVKSNAPARKSLPGSTPGQLKTAKLSQAVHASSANMSNSLGRGTEGAQLRSSRTPEMPPRTDNDRAYFSIDPFAFDSLVDEIVQAIAPGKGVQLDHDAMRVLQEVAEAHLVGLFDVSYRCTINAGRKMLMPVDMLLARRIRKEINVVAMPAAAVLAPPPPAATGAAAAGGAASNGDATSGSVSGGDSSRDGVLLGVVQQAAGAAAVLQQGLAAQRAVAPAQATHMQGAQATLPL